MKALLQRVANAAVHVAGEPIAAIGPGLLVFLALERDDDGDNSLKMQEKILNYRLFGDGQGKMNRSVRDVGGEILLVSQFTLAANTNRGRRPSFDGAMAPAAAAEFFQRFAAQLQAAHGAVQLGQFGADMAVSLVNDGPVTFLLEV